MTHTSTAEAVQVSETLDCKGMKCPLPIYKSSLALRNLAKGHVLEVVCTDPGSLHDFRALANQTGHELLKSEDTGGVQTFWLRRAG